MATGTPASVVLAGVAPSLVFEVRVTDIQGGKYGPYWVLASSDIDARKKAIAHVVGQETSAEIAYCEIKFAGIIDIP